MTNEELRTTVIVKCSTFEHFVTIWSDRDILIALREYAKVMTDEELTKLNGFMPQEE